MQPNFPPGISRLNYYTRSILYKTTQLIQEIAFPFLPDFSRTPTPVWQPVKRTPRFPYNKKGPAPVQKEMLHRL
ncbi:MAG: hypothetical protein FGM61_02250 [Sediminibacterium sp.]|nr:hypothetical protein [Sediminibacterium sp.]